MQPARSDRAPPHERQAPGEPVKRAGQPGHGAAARHRAGETAQPFAPSRSDPSPRAQARKRLRGGGQGHRPHDTSPARPSPTPSPPCAGRSGANRGSPVQPRSQHEEARTSPPKQRHPRASPGRMTAKVELRMGLLLGEAERLAFARPDCRVCNNGPPEHDDRFRSRAPSALTPTADFGAVGSARGRRWPQRRRGGPYWATRACRPVRSYPCRRARAFCRSGAP